ncbi:MAG TPA: hypothetical protein VMX97_12630 [Hyphomicrobiaceae bacterium]|nr:hypothetical protein [Hyphomicrobiaceae bacterium]
MEAYGIKPPDGYEVTEGEKTLLSNVVADLHSKNMGKAEVSAVIDHYYQAQAAGLQEQRKVAIERQTEWQRELETELGRDYKATQAAGEAYLNSVFADNMDAKNELLMAQLPGGGYLGDNPQFFRMVADLALQNGFSDRIEANAYESNGKSLGDQQSEIEALRTTNPERYNDPQTQQKLDKIIGLRLSRGEIDEMGNPVRQRR